MALSGYSEDVLEEIRSGCDIVDVVSGYVALRLRGGDYWGLCPFHRESSPSFHVRPAEQFYHCFGCGAGGNVFGFVMRVENVGFIDAVRLVAERIHYTLPSLSYSPEYERKRKERELYIEVNKLAAKFYYEKLTGAEGERARVYLDGRGVSMGARKSFGLGYAPFGDELLNNLNVNIDGEVYEGDDRIRLLNGAGLITEKEGKRRDRFRGRLMFPIFDPLDKLIAFGGRLIEDGGKGALGPKYLNSPDTAVFDKSRNVYALNRARRSKEDYIVIAEGYMDVISLHQSGFTASAAALGTAFTPGHARLIAKYKKKAVVLFDSDEAGVKAALRAIPILTAAGADVKVLSLEGAKDPDEFLNKYGREKFALALKGAEHYAAFQISAAKKRFDFSQTVEKARFAQAAAEIISGLESPSEREAYITETAADAGITGAAVRDEVSKYIELNKNRAAIGGAYQTAGYTGKPMAQEDKAATKADDEARRGVLAAMAKRADIIPQVIKCLAAEELVESVYIRLYKLLVEKNGAGKTGGVTLAQIANNFETDEEQRIVAAVFESRDEKGGSAEVFYKSVNDHIRNVKRAFIERGINAAAAADDGAGIIKLMENKKQLETKAVYVYYQF